MMSSKLVFLKSLVLALAFAGAGAWAAASNGDEALKSNGVGTVEAPLGDRFAVFPRVAAQQARAIFYRPITQAQPGAATVYVNGYYHASLIPGGYAELCMAPAQAEVGVRMVKVGDRPKDNLEAISLQNLKAGQTVFLRFRESDLARPFFEPVAASVALAELAPTRQQIHTISRVPEAQTCIDAGPQAAQPEQFNLVADALFAFGKSDSASMTAAGRQSLDDLVRKIKSEYFTVDRIHLIGHADPLGNEALNVRLAQERALTVRSYLLSHGLPNTRITGQSKGSSEPIVTTCGNEFTPAAVLCNQPNRRVVVEIFGVQRSN